MSRRGGYHRRAVGVSISQSGGSCSALSAVGGGERWNRGVLLSALLSPSQLHSFSELPGGFQAVREICSCVLVFYIALWTLRDPCVRANTEGPCEEPSRLEQLFTIKVREEELGYTGSGSSPFIPLQC